jgi:hypothetical protein
MRKFRKSFLRQGVPVPSSVTFGDSFYQKKPLVRQNQRISTRPKAFSLREKVAFAKQMTDEGR